MHCRSISSHESLNIVRTTLSLDDQLRFRCRGPEIPSELSNPRSLAARPSVYFHPYPSDPLCVMRPLAGFSSAQVGPSIKPATSNMRSHQSRGAQISILLMAAEATELCKISRADACMMKRLASWSLLFTTFERKTTCRVPSVRRGVPFAGRTLVSLGGFPTACSFVQSVNNLVADNGHPPLDVANSFCPPLP